MWRESENQNIYLVVETQASHAAEGGARPVKTHQHMISQYTQHGSVYISLECLVQHESNHVR